MPKPWNKFALLGSGSHEPGVCVLDVEQHETHKVLSFPEGDSAYSMAIAPRGDLLAVGTRSGSLFLVRGEVEAMISHPEEGRNPVAYRSPILSLCFIGQDRLVVATASRTFWLNTAAPGVTHDMETRGDIVCALAAVSETEVFGLSPTGQLLGWTIPDGRCSRRHCGPPPGDVWGLVRLEYWAAASALAYGAGNGDLVLCPVQEKTCDVRPAHTGELYAIASSEHCLLTAGRHDRRLKLWMKGSPTAVADHPCPMEATSAAFIKEHPLRFVLVDAQGRADVFEVGTDKLQFRAVISGATYRIAISPDLARQRMESAAAMEKISGEIVPALMAREHFGAVEEQCTTLDALGYPYVALWFRAEIAAAQQDRKLDELRIRHTLHSEYNQTDLWFEAARIRYADLLMDLWRFEEAANVFAHLAERKVHADCASKQERARQMLGRMHTQGVIADPGGSLAVLIQAAGVTKTPFSGWWVVSRAEERTYAGVVRTPADILEACQSELAGLPQGVTFVQKEVVFLQQSGERRALALVFEGPDGRGATCLQYLLVPKSYAGGFTVTSTIVLSVNVDISTGDVEQHNCQVMAVFKEAQASQLRYSWIWEADRVTSRIVRNVYSHPLWQLQADAGSPSC